MCYTKSIRICVLSGTLYGILCVPHNTNPPQMYKKKMHICKYKNKKVQNFALFCYKRAQPL